MELLAKNLHLYKRMKDLASQQEKSASEEQMDVFLQLANQREQIRHQIIDNEKKSGSSEKGISVGRLRPASRPVVSEIAEVIRSIQEIDRQTEEFVFRKREATLLELRNLKEGRKAVRGYGGKGTRGAADARFIDRKG